MKQLALRILWPAFIFAGVLEMMVFAVIDPHEMRWFGGVLIGWSSMATYSVTFFIFWWVIAGSGALTALLAQTAAEVNAMHDEPRPPDA